MIKRPVAPACKLSAQMLHRDGERADDNCAYGHSATTCLMNVRATTARARTRTRTTASLVSDKGADDASIHVSFIHCID
jgi:hypothetical protein